MKVTKVTREKEVVTTGAMVEFRNEELHSLYRMKCKINGLIEEAVTRELANEQIGQAQFGPTEITVEADTLVKLEYLLSEMTRTVINCDAETFGYATFADKLVTARNAMNAAAQDQAI